MRNKAFVWYDPEGVLEVTFGDHPGEGEMMATKAKGVWVRVDDEGNVIGFQLVGINKLALKETELDLTPIQRPRLEGNHRPS
jgi:hypothetical protein